MDDFITIYYWARIAVLALVTLVALVTVIRMSARRPFKLWREVVFGALTVALFGVASAVVGVHYGVPWAAVLVVLGLLVGYFASRGDRVSREDGRLMLRRSPVVPLVWFVAVVLAFATLLFAMAASWVRRSRWRGPRLRCWRATRRPPASGGRPSALWVHSLVETESHGGRRPQALQPAP